MKEEVKLDIQYWVSFLSIPLFFTISGIVYENIIKFMLAFSVAAIWLMVYSITINQIISKKNLN